MIRLYLAQTMPLISTMKQSLEDKNWDALYSAAHKMIPSFLIMGIHKDFEDIARKIQENARTLLHIEDIKNMILQLEGVCTQALLN